MSEPPNPPRPLSLIVAMDRNRVIGHRGKLPWHLPADLQRFKALTMGHHIIMGRRTWESIGRPLPGRTSVVISRDPAYRTAGALLATSLADALALAKHDPEPFVIGGAEVFRQAMPFSNRLYLTEVLADYPGDVWFPALPQGEWREVDFEHHPASDAQPGWNFRVYQRSTTA